VRAGRSWRGLRIARAVGAATAATAALAVLLIAILAPPTTAERAERGAGADERQLPSLEALLDALQHLRLEAADGAADLAAPLLARWIAASREEALAAGTQPVPQTARARLEGFFAADLLDRVRFRIGGGSGPTLQGGLLRWHRNHAITLIDVIVFRDEAIARDPLIWAHELTHVQQYDALGLDAFARRYVRDPRAMEAEAWDQMGYYKSWARRHGKLPDGEATRAP
jgi:hypothetical protein